MRDQHQRGTGRAGLVAQHVQHAGRGGRIEVAGGFVRQQQPGLVHQRTGDRHALQLPTAQFLRQAGAQSGQPHRLEHLRHACGIRPLQQQQRQAHVLRHVQVRQHVKGLEHEAELFAAQQRPRVVVQGGQVNAVHPHAARLPHVESGHAIEQRRLAHARFADDGDELARRHRQRDVVEHRRLAIALGQRIHHEHHGRTPAAASTRCRASGASQEITWRWGMPRSHVSWRLASWRVAAMPRSRRVSGGQAPSSVSQACR